jgi:predicted ABC-type ATPase
MTPAEQPDEQPTVYVIAGPNGAGKTTFARQFVPAAVASLEFLNADLIAAGLAPFAPESQSVRAGRLLLERFRDLALAKQSFAVETTLSGKTYLKTFRQLRRDGYVVKIDFLWLPLAQMAVDRVANRVLQGGHFVPDVDVRRRHAAGLRNFFTDYQEVFDEWRLYNASERPPRLIAQRVAQEVNVLNADEFAACEAVIRGQLP